MAFNDATINETSIDGDDVLSYAPSLDYWVLIGGATEGHVLMDSLNIEETEDGNKRARCTVINPNTSILEGKTFSVIWRGEVVFAGIIRTATVDADQAESAFLYAIEADGWDAVLARHTITASYANQTAGFVLRDAITTSGVNLDGVTDGTIDAGPNLILVEANHVRVGDFIRDVGSAGGGFASIDPYKRIQFRPTTLDVSDVPVTNARCEKISHMGDLDNYRNRDIVKVTGLDGTTTVTETRNDLAQQALRIADEGGSGIYEAYQEVKHPTSSVSGELSILGQTVGYVDLRTYARNARRVTVTMRDPAPRIGQITTLDLPGFTLSGTFVAMRKTWRDIGGQFLFDIEFWESSFQQQALQSLLKIVGAGKSTVSISAEVFPNVQLFSTPGSGFTWTVPGGVLAAQFTAYGGSGGAGGNLNINHGFPPPNTTVFYGGNGGRGGKAVTILATTPAQVFDITVGAGGNGGQNGRSNGTLLPYEKTPTDGTPGSSTIVSLSGVVKCQGDLGTQGTHAFISPPFAFNGVNGTNGGGIGDAVVVGGGHDATNNHDWNSDGVQADQPDGMVEVRW